MADDRFNAREVSDLAKDTLQGMAVIGLAVKRHGADDKVAFGGGGIAGLAAKLILLVGFALGDTFHLRGVPDVKLGLCLGVQGLVINNFCLAKINASFTSS